MTVQCTNCDKRAENKDKLKKFGCTCNSEVIKVTDERDHIEVGDIGSFTKTKGKQTTKFTIIGNKIEKIKTIGVVNGIAYVLVNIAVKAVTSKETFDKEAQQETSTVVEITHQNMPYFVNSRREIIPANDSSLQEKFQVPMMLNGMDARWDILDLLDFVEGRSVKINGDDVFQEIKKELKKYIELKSEGHYDLVILWIMGTYFSRQFDYYPYLDIRGTKGSAKSKLLRFIEQLVFNGVWFSNISGAAAYRIIESTGSTLCLDEAENLKTPKTERDQFILQLLKGAFAMDNKSIINIPTNEGWMPYPFDAGTCIAMGHINGIDDVLADRTIKILMQMTLNKEISKTGIDKTDKIWQNLRNKLYRLFLENYDEITEISKQNYDSKTIQNRELHQIWKPIITMARFFERKGSEGIISRLESVIDESHQNRVLVDQTSNIDVQILELVVTFLLEEPKLKEVHGWRDFYRQDDIFHKIQTRESLSWIKSSGYVGSSLDRLGFPRKKKNDAGMVVQITETALRNACLRHSVEFPSLPASMSQQEEKIDSYGDIDDESDKNNQKQWMDIKDIQSETSDKNETSKEDVKAVTSLTSPKASDTDYTHWECKRCRTGLREINESSESTRQGGYRNILHVHEKNKDCKKTIKMYTRSEADAIFEREKNRLR